GSNSSNVGVGSATGNKIDLKNSDGNIVVSKTAGNNDVTFDLANDLTADSVTLGNTTVNTNGLSISGGPSVTTSGINAAGTVITNVAAGSVDATSTDAINGSQLNTTNQNVAQNTASITSLDGRVTTVEGDVTTLQSGLQSLADTPITFTGNSGSVTRKLGEALGLTGLGSTAGTYSGSNLKTEVDATTGEVKLQMAENPEFSSVVTGNTTLNSSGLTISGGPSVTTTGINAAGTSISNVAAGVSGTDAVNVNQLNAVNTVAGAGWDVTAQGSNSSNVGASSATGNKLDLKNSDGNIVVSKTAGNNDVTFDLANALTADSVTLGNTTVNTNGLTISGGPSVTTTGINAAGTTISNVAAGGISATSTDAINGSQLNTTNQNVAQNTANITTLDGRVTSLDGRVTTVEGDVTTLQGGLQNLADTPITFTGNSGSVTRKLGEALGLTGLGSTAGTYSGSNLKTEVDPTTGEMKLQMAENPEFTSVVTGNTTLNTNGLTISGGPSITTAGINAAGTNISNVAAGVSGTDAVNVNQLNAVNTVAGAGWDVSAQGSNSSNVGVSSATGNKIDLKNSDGNIVVSKTAGNNDVTFDLANDLAVDSVTLGGTTLNSSGLTIGGGPSVTMAGINAAGTVITNVAPGGISATSTDAINGSQLNTTNQNVAQNTTNITSLDGRVTTVEGDVTTLQSGLQNLADTPITFTGNSGSVMRKLGEALGLTGLGSTAGTYSGSNLKTEVDSTTGEVKLQMAENPEFTSVVTGNTTLNSSGLTISGGPSVTTTGINAAGTTISNVTAGVSGSCRRATYRTGDT
ncbi:hypothetical protein HUT00_36745, partial [Pseudomonas chlororaphis]|nr:hypothetical protein [Pseudomonas chlororaphis]